jgi:ribokinase
MSPTSPTGPDATPPPGAGRVVVVGSANADLVVTVERRPAAGETVPGGDLRTLPGGKGANQAVAAARLGAATAFVGRVGNDAHGTMLLHSLEAAGVDVTGVRRDDAPTGVAIVTLTPDGDNTIVVSPGANGRVTADDARHDAVRTAAVLLLQREIDGAASLAAAELCPGRVVLTLAPSGPVPEALLARTDVLVVNEHEAADLLGASVPPSEAAAQLRARGPRAVVVTLGAAGAVAVDDDGTHRAAAPRVDAVDTVGAGDAFTGALGWRLAAGDDLAAALAVAVRVGALAVTREGAQPSFPTAAELAAGPGT